MAETFADWVIGPYVNLLGNWFWVIIMFLAVGAVYLRTRSFGPTFLVLLVGSSILNAFIPGGEIRAMLFFAVVFGILYTFFRLLVHRAGAWLE